MTPITLTPGQLIHENGIYQIGTGIPGSRVLVEWAGNLGTAVVAVGRRDLKGDFAAYHNAAGVPLIFSTSADLWELPVSGRNAILLRITGATGSTTAIGAMVTRATDS